MIHNNNNFIFALGILAVTMSSAQVSSVNGQAAAGYYEPCADNEESVEFIFTGDAQSPQDNGWRLTCGEGLDQPTSITGDIVAGEKTKLSEQETVWNVPAGSLQTDTDYVATGTVQRRECIPTSWTCSFILTDASTDGLVDSESFFVLRYGANTIVTYEQQAFSQLEYCLGLGCDEESDGLTVGIPTVPTDSSCIVTRFDITLDDRPEDVTFKVTCGPGLDNYESIVIWEGSGFGPEDAGLNIEHEDCLHSVYCCKLVVTDASGDGLSEAVQTESGPRYGSLHFDWNDEPILAYEGEDDLVGFEVINKSFGYTCNAKSEDVSINKVEQGDVEVDNDNEWPYGSSISRTGMIILIVCMSLLCLTILILGYVCWRRRRTSQNRTAVYDDDQDDIKHPRPDYTRNSSAEP